MANLPKQADLNNLKKFPWQWAIIVLLGAISASVALYLSRVNKSDVNCDERVASLQRAASRKDSIIFDWQTKYINITNELLYKNNIIDRQKMVINSTDSVARKRLERPAKQIIKNNE